MSDGTLKILGLVGLAVVMLYFLFGRGGSTLTGPDARKLVAEGAILVDVRTTDEFRSGHIEGAVNIPLSQLEKRLKEFGAKEKPVVLYCASGARSSSAAGILKKNGWQQVQNLGAMSRW